MASFTADARLEECTDLVVRPPPEFYDRGPDAGAAFLDAFLASAMKGRKPTPTRIYRSCVEQFHGKPQLASCTLRREVHVSTDAGVDLGTYSIEVVGRYYDLDTLARDDRSMKDCLDGQGDWQGVDPQSDEYREAVRGRARRDVERIERLLNR